MSALAERAAAMFERVELEDEDDVDGFRRAARRLILAGVEPGRVSWQVAMAREAELFPATADAATTAGAEAEADSAPSAALKLPAWFLPLCERAALHADPDRHGLLYRLAWRLAHEPGLRDDTLDPDRLQVEALARTVRREMHKMTAFVRFRPPDEPSGVHVAWFEPAHHVVAATAPFFARRFAQMRWAILTPQRCVQWDGEVLAFSGGARREDAPPADAAVRLWLTYYESIFNPARLKLSMMRKEMPRRYWKNLPEAASIGALSAAAAQRSARMIDQPAGEPVRRRPQASVALQREAPPVGGSSSQQPLTLAALAQGLQRCRGCPIGAAATQAVPGEGPPDARLVLVGEQPGDHEDLRGRPFVGPAGQLLDRALAALGWRRDALYLTNAVKHFKHELRGKRRLHKTPAQQEAAACLQWLEHEIGLLQAEAAIALGATAARALLGRDVAVTRERGRWLQRPDGLRVLVTLHPAALLRMEAADREAAFAAWLDDLRQASAFAPRVQAGASV